ncbi:hypothetical protein BDW69DRAFT_179193 [Aspergillus filifer]
MGTVLRRRCEQDSRSDPTSVRRNCGEVSTESTLSVGQKYMDRVLCLLNSNVRNFVNSDAAERRWNTARQRRYEPVSRFARTLGGEDIGWLRSEFVAAC